MTLHGYVFLSVILFTSITHRMVATKWTPSAKWMLDTTLSVYILITLFGATFLSGEFNLISDLLKMF